MGALLVGCKSRWVRYWPFVCRPCQSTGTCLPPRPHTADQNRYTPDHGDLNASPTRSTHGDLNATPTRGAREARMVTCMPPLHAVQGRHPYTRCKGGTAPEHAWRLECAPTPPARSQHSCQLTAKPHLLPLVWIFPLGKGYYGGAGGSSWDLP